MSNKPKENESTTTFSRNAEKDQKRAEIEKQIKEFLKNGGKITKLDRGGEEVS